MQYDEFQAMNSAIVLAAAGDDDARLEKGFAEARDYILSSEQRFTRFTDTSELADLNRSAGEWFQVSDEMFQVLEAARRLDIETEGLFNPAILPALKQAGYDRSMDLIRNGPPRTGAVAVMEISDFRLVELDPATFSVRLPDGMQIDLGGIAKGWIVEQAAKKLVKYSSACAVSAGGDMFLVNLPTGVLLWDVGLENPLSPEEDLAVLHVGPGGVATSSTAKRRWTYNGKVQHHLIDPRTGLPAQAEWMSVTVWAESMLEAEVYAKALLIAGPHETEKLLDGKQSIAYLAVDKKGWVTGSGNYHEVFHV